MSNDEMIEPNTMPRPLTRRTILAGAGVIGAGLVAAACGAAPEMRATPAANQSATRTAGAPAAGAKPAAVKPLAPSATDVAVAQLAAGLEVLAVGTYQAALDAAGAKKLGDVPPAVATFVGTAMKQHQAHLDAWNKVLTTNGAAAVSEPNATLKPFVDGTFANVTDVGGAAMLALTLEQIAAATYQSAQAVLTDKDAIQLAGSIQIVDAQHVALLLYALGEYPVPDTFAKIDVAVAPGQAPVAAPAPTAGAPTAGAPTAAPPSSMPATL